MSKYFQFTFANLEKQYKLAIDAGYEFITCIDYVKRKKCLPQLTVVNRVDIDVSVKKADRLREIFDRLGIKASFFVRLHAPEYNPFSFENYRILKAIRDSGHEIGYHSEIVDQAEIWGEESDKCLRRDLKILNQILDIEVKGVASHGGATGLNNLNFWEHHKPSEFDLFYEAYDKEPEFNLFQNSIYISDSEDIRWKCYDHGRISQGDNRSFAEHIVKLPKLVYLLVHPDARYDRHIYE